MFFRHFHRWRRREDGAAAVEFALVAMPFFLMIVGVLEIALFFAAGTVLEGGAAAAARLIRTGQIQDTADPEEAFRTALCNHVSSMIPCNQLQYEVILMEEGTFAQASEYEPEFDEDGNLVPGGFSMGGTSDVVLVRTAYRYEFLTPFLGSIITGDAGRNWSMHMAMSVIKAEPYSYEGG
jgi:Flp pilus assembly protein TadG